jgi:L-threonylcarbamoyladenylate synthase
MIDAEAVARVETSVRAGGVAVIPTDTVYGLVCSPDDPRAVSRLYELKGRDEGKPAAVLFADRGQVFGCLPELGPLTRAAVVRLLPGPVTLLVPDSSQRFVLASRGDAMTLGVRVPDFSGPLESLRGLTIPLLQSSANQSGGADPRTLDEVPAVIRAGADRLLDAGELPGTPSTVVDLRAFETDAAWSVVREGAMAARDVDRVLSGVVSAGGAG